MQTMYQIALSRINGVGIATAQKLLALVGEDCKCLFDNAIEDIIPEEKGVHEKFNDEAKKEALEIAERELEFVEANAVKPVFFQSVGYPSRLRECKEAPLILYQNGEAELNSLRSISIVGTRQPTQQGIDTTKTLVKEIAEQFPNTTIVSGLAYGIDVTAHKAALRYGLPTVGVLGHGLQMLYPAAHRSVAQRMRNEGGALLTQYTSVDKVHPKNFIQRNVIVATLSDAVLVVESKEKGGAMTTAQIAASYGRDVLAVPGSIFEEKSKGCNKLIKNQLAALIESVKDIAYSLRWEMKSENPQQQLLFDLSEEEQKIVQVLQQKGKINIDTLSMELKTTTSKLLPIITQLEFNGVLLPHPGKFYSLRK